MPMSSPHLPDRDQQGVLQVQVETTHTCTHANYQYCPATKAHFLTALFKYATFSNEKETTTHFKVEVIYSLYIECLSVDS